MRFEQPAKQRDRTEERVLLVTVPSLEKAHALSSELSAYAVDAMLHETDEGWSLYVLVSELLLARTVCDPTDTPSTDVVPAGPRRVWVRSLPPEDRRLVCRPGRLLRMAMAVGALGLGLSVVSSLATGSAVAVPAAVSHWSSSGLAFHSDDNIDGTVDRIVVLDKGGRTRSVWVDDNYDGVIDKIIRVESGPEVVSVFGGDSVDR